MSSAFPHYPPRFVYRAKDQTVGPFDVVELAAELRYGHIDAKTLISRSGSDEWVALRDLPEFTTIQGISIEEIAHHIEVKAREGVPSQSNPRAPIPVSVIAAIVLLVGAALVYFFDPGLMGTSTNDAPPVQSEPTFTFAKQFQTDTEVVSKRGTVLGKLYADNGNTRHEASSQGVSTIVITRPDRSRVYLVIPSEKLVIQNPLSLKENAKSRLAILTSPDAKFQLLDDDNVEGIACTKYKVATSEPSKFFFLWVDTLKQVPVKVSEINGDSSVVYRNFQAGPQDPALFEPPSDYEWR